MSSSATPHHEAEGLERFVEAQEDVYAGALAELRRGRKTSHWMWFIFPQLVGLGRSETARFYGVRGEAEAQRYIAHPVLGPRLLECTTALLSHTDRTAEAILGATDAMKLRSSLTLFEAVAPEPAVFAQAHEQFYDGGRDERTLALLGDA